MNYYNDNDAYAAQWLRNLVAVDALPAGTVDARSIADIEPDDLQGYRSCHFFAGIGGWAHALELAGWPLDRPVWTGSCPCQPFSSAGKQRGGADERHLWPLWLRLILVCRPDAILGEQVAGAVGFGWLDRVCADLEEIGYAVGAAVLGAHSVGAPHIRQRLFWVGQLADADGLGPGARRGDDGEERGLQETQRQPEHRAALSGGSSSTGGLADAGRKRRDEQPIRLQPGQPRQTGAETAGGSATGANPWTDSTWLPCLDGKARRTQSGIHPLVDGVPARVGRLRAYGNAIVPQAAAEFIRAVMDAG